MVNDWSGVRLFLAKKINTECSSRVTLDQKFKLMFTIVTTVPLRFIKKELFMLFCGLMQPEVKFSKSNF